MLFRFLRGVIYGIDLGIIIVGLMRHDAPLVFIGFVSASIIFFSPDK